MGGKGAGHKSVKALLSRQRNIQKARAARRRAPLPWRSGMESRVIEQLVWQWFQSSGEWRVASGEKKQRQVLNGSGQERQKGSGPLAALRVNEWLVASGEQAKAGPAFAKAATARQASGEKRQKQVLNGSGQCSVVSDQKRDMKRDSASRAGRVNPAPTRGENAIGSPQIIARPQNKPWSAVRVARLLGVSHTWVNKLVKRMEADPEGMRRKMRAFAPASLDTLERAREETQRQRELGRLRGPIRWRRVKVKIQGRERKLAVPTAEEMKRRERSKAVASGEWLVASKQRQQHENEYVAYREVPEWARGLVLTGDTGSMITRGAGVRMPPIKTGTPRPVPFAFRRRR